MVGGEEEDEEVEDASEVAPKGKMAPHLAAMREKVTAVLAKAGHDSSRAAGLSIDDLLGLLVAFNREDIHFA